MPDKRERSKEIYSKYPLYTEVSEGAYYQNTFHNSQSFTPSEITRKIVEVSKKTDSLETRLETLTGSFHTLNSILMKIDDRTERTSATLTKLVEGTLMLPKCAERENEMMHINKELSNLTVKDLPCETCATTHKALQNERDILLIMRVFKTVGMLSIGTVIVLFITALWNKVAI